MSDTTEQPVTTAPTIATSVPAPTVQREPNGRWLPGSVPNPGGRPKSPIIDGKTANQRLSEMVPRALEIQAELLENPLTPPSLKNSIAQSILDRVIGKAVNQIDVTSVNLTQTVTNSRIDASVLSLEQLRLLASIDAMIADDVNGDDGE